MKAKNLKEWHKEVCRREKYICESCKRDYSSDYYFLPDGRNWAVIGHHDETQGSHPEKKLDTDVGKCLCTIQPGTCHQKINNGNDIKKVDNVDKNKCVSIGFTGNLKKVKNYKMETFKKKKSTKLKPRFKEGKTVFDPYIGKNIRYKHKRSNF